MSFVSDPNIAFVLLIVGVLTIYVEFCFPGLILPGVVGGILVMVGLSGIAALPISPIGVALLLLSAFLLVLEAKFAWRGILGAAGALSMTLGAVLLIEGPPETRIRLGTALALTLPFAVITILLLSLALRARANKMAG